VCLIMLYEKVEKVNAGCVIKVFLIFLTNTQRELALDTQENWLHSVNKRVELYLLLLCACPVRRENKRKLV